ncbi:MAG TPA: HAD hydrolase family protein [Candidatus Kapabacteria bacterium]|nr:HAD hydrolase family protein [Candidatus Kapabacteria bacterium]
MAALSRSLRQKLSRIELFLMDVDGTMTDGSMWSHDDGTESKRFDVKDGMGIVQLRLAGIPTGIVTARTSKAVAFRAKDLKMPIVIQGIHNKAGALEILRKKKVNVSPEQIAYIGDEINDIPLMKLVGFSAAPRDAMPEVKKVADYVCTANGGHGAVREICDLILQSKNLKPKFSV